MMRRKHSSAFLLGIVMMVVSVIYLALPADPISSAIQRVLFGIDNLASNEVNSQQPGLEEDNLIAELQNENQRLKKQLNYNLGDKFEYVTASVVSKSVQNYRSTFDINAGSSAGIEVGQAVMNMGQLIGRISEVFDDRSRMITISDPDFRAAAIISSTKSEGLVRHVAGGVIIEQVPVGSQSKKLLDNTVLTSGLGGVFPPGLLIGRVGDDISASGAIFREFVLEKTIDLATVEEVVVLKQ